MLEIGCGTGVLADALARRDAGRVWAVDPEPAMLEQARARVPDSVGLKLASAESLPFRDGWFERAVMRLVVHLVDRTRALPELARVVGPGGRVAIATFDPEHFDGLWLNRLFPSLEEIDRARFPDPAAVARELQAAGFASARVVRLSQRTEIDRESALEKIRGRHISTFDLLDEAEIAEGAERADRELAERVEVALEWGVVIAER